MKFNGRGFKSHSHLLSMATSKNCSTVNTIYIPYLYLYLSPFHRIFYGYSRADWDGLPGHLRDVPLEDIFIKNIRSSLIHLHGFQPLVLLP